MLVLEIAVPGARIAAQATPSDPIEMLKPYAASAAQAPLGDYVPCLFDDDERRNLRALPSVGQKVTLDGQAAQALITLTQNDVNAQIPQPIATKDKSAPAPTAEQGSAAEFTGKLPAEAQKLEGLTIPAALKTLTDLAADAKLPTTDAQALLKTLDSQIGLNGYQRPPDVSCSFSIMPWEETDEFFGRMVANNYVAIEVNIRNLNTQNEFLLHDIQVAVDTGLDPQSFGRFEAGRDKMIVRGVAQRGASDDIRNRVINSITTLGSVAGGASGALIASASKAATWPTYISESVSIFEGPLLDGLNKIWPDHTLTNVNNVSDMAFSASSTLKTVIPVQGSAPLVTFIAQKPLGQLPFAQCGKKTGSGDPPNVVCAIAGGSFFTSGDFHFPPSLKFKSWAPAALGILKQRTYVVVSGVHIQEVSTAASATFLSCPPLADGTVDLSAQDSSGEVSCTIQGKNLDKISSASLEQGKSTSVIATITAAGGDSGNLSFQASGFEGKSGSFGLFSTDSSGTETSLNESLKFTIRTPVITKVAYMQNGSAVATLDSTMDLTVTLTGSNLDRIGTVSLEDNNAAPDTVPGTMPATGEIRANSTSMSITFVKSATGIGTLKGPAGKAVANLRYTALDIIATEKAPLKVTPSDNDPGVKLP
jgi:hypothetical protein